MSSSASIACCGCVQAEMRQGLSYFHSTIFNSLPTFYRRIDTALKQVPLRPPASGITPVKFQCCIVQSCQAEWMQPLHWLLALHNISVPGTCPYHINTDVERALFLLTRSSAGLTESSLTATVLPPHTYWADLGSALRADRAADAAADAQPVQLWVVDGRRPRRQPIRDG